MKKLSRKNIGKHVGNFVEYYGSQRNIGSVKEMETRNFIDKLAKEAILTKRDLNGYLQNLKIFLRSFEG